MDTQFHMMKKERGFILLDLCMAIGIVVIVLALTIPYRAFDREKFLVDQTVRNFAAVMRQSQFMNLGTGRIYTNVFHLMKEIFLLLVVSIIPPILNGSTNTLAAVVV